jgi:hypothetical protein
MMKFLSRSVDRKGTDHQTEAPVPYQSVITSESTALPGVVFVINRISFGRRMELSRLVREITRKAEFLEAGTELQERIEAGILTHEVDAMYLRWGLVSLEGLTIDGMPAAPEQLLDSGPEALTQEIVAAIKAQCGRTEAERKN